MRKIDRKTADPEILNAYEQLRFERRYPKLEVLAYVIRALGYGGLLPILFIPAGARPTYLWVWMSFAGVAILMEFSLLVAWQPRGRRMKAVAFVFAALAFVGALVVGFNALMYWLL